MIKTAAPTMAQPFCITILVVFDFFWCNDIMASGNMAKVGFGDNDVDRGFRVISRIRCKVIYPR